MLNRLSNIIKSIFNRVLNVAEDPVLILENNIRELQSKIPDLNQSVAKSHSTIIILQNEFSQCISDIQKEDNQIKAALKVDNQKVAENAILRMQKLKSKELELKEKLESSQQKLSQVVELRDFSVEQIKTKINQIKDAISQYDSSKLQRELAESISDQGSFDINSISSTTNLMLDKMKNQTALNQGVFASSLSNNPDFEEATVTKQARQMEAAELLKEYKQNLKLDE